ncbi:MAG: hypothetical protein R3297_10730, partial [Desulfobulbales bacterium]|nr:hypothetical protein [Desulfobulbales bacterium]
MQSRRKEKSQYFREIFPKCSRLVAAETWQELINKAETPELLPVILKQYPDKPALPGYLSELARLELFVFKLNKSTTPVPNYSKKLSINPTLELFDNSWRNLACHINDGDVMTDPEKGHEHVIIWRRPADDRIKAKPAGKDDLLAMKMALENISVQDAASEGNVHAAAIEVALIRALDEGIVIGPEPGIKRDYNPENFTKIDQSFFSARIFALQWHITQACDLHCRHCYDRNLYQSLSLQQEIDILDNLAEFCSSHKVHGQVTFTGGNPLLHPHF